MTRSILATAAFALVLAACNGSAPTPDDTQPTDGEASQPGETGINKLGDLVPWNGARDGVQLTDSGLQYLVISEGPADAPSPSARDTVQVIYEGRIADTGEKFDSSYDRGGPARFPVNGVIAGWTEGLQLMSQGDEFVFFIPSELGYGQNPRPGGVIQPGDDLVFHVALETVEQAPPPKSVDAQAWDTYTPWDSSREGVQSTDSGLEYVVLEEAEGDNPSPSGGDTVVVFYEGRLDETGEMFDSAFERGEPALFPANRVIPGWVEALQLMERGDRWLIHLPSDLAYGDEGTPGGPIPPNADLNFEVELMDVLKTQ